MKLKYTLVFTIISFFIATAGFAQTYSDKEIGLNVEKLTVALKKHGVKDEDMPREISRVREINTTQYTQNLKKQATQNTVASKTAKSSKQAVETATPAELAQDRAALFALYNSTGGANWYNTQQGKGAWPINDPNAVITTSWDPATNTGWYGVGMDARGRVVTLELDNNNLSGTLPSQIGQLSALWSIRIKNNISLTGTIPTQIGQLPDLLGLELNNNSLSGTIPSQIGQLSTLIKLDLSSNPFTGSLPIAILNMSNLKELDLSYIPFGGNIPPEIGNLSSIETLELFSNGFTGSIPVEINNLSKVEWLQLGGNELTGDLPAPQIGQLPSLKEYHLDYNNLTGNLPPEIKNLTNLGQISVYDNEMTGPLPPELGQLKNVYALSLEKNNFTGTIPPEIGNMTELFSFDVTENQLTGSIPETFRNLKQLKHIYVGDNKFSGKIPDLTVIPLKTLHIYRNAFRFVDFADEHAAYKSMVYQGNNSMWYIYCQQAFVDEEKTIVKNSGESVTFTMYEDGRFTPNDTYQWYHFHGDTTLPIPSATSRTYTVENIKYKDGGDYYCISTNPYITDTMYWETNLYLTKSKIHLNVNVLCEPTVGTIKTPTETISANQDINISFESISKDLTYNWTFYDLDNTTVLLNTTDSSPGLYYPLPGTYKINLVVTDENRCTTSFDKTITIAPQVCPVVTGTIKTGANNLFVNANSLFYLDSPTYFTSYEWTFYDLNNNIDETVYGNYRIKSFSAPGNYRVRITVIDANRCKTSIDKTVTVTQPQACQSLETGTIFSGENDTVYINTNNEFYFNTNTDQYLHYNWTIYNPDNTIYNTFIGNDNYISGLNFTIAGTYKIILKITDMSGCTATFSRNFNVMYNCYTYGMIKDRDYPFSNEGLQPVVANTNLTLFYNSFTSDTENKEYSWSFLSPNGDIIKTGNGENFDVTPTTIGDYKVKVQLTDTVTGCVNSFDAILPCVNECEMSNSERGGKITINGDYDTSEEAIFVELNEPIDLGLNRTYYSDTGRPLSFEWSLLNPNSQIISTGTDTLFPIVLTSSGFYKVVLKVTDAFNGCSTEVTRAFANQMDNSCTQTNERSSQVQELAKALAKKFLQRTASGETDVQINNNTVVQEFIALKPFITNSPKDKIYNYKTVRDKYNAIISMDFSFSPDREYDFHFSIRDGLYTNGVTPEYLDYLIDKAVYVDISQYVSSNETLASCWVYGQNNRSAAKSVLEPKDCRYSSEIKNINFCPPACNEITGTLKESNQEIFTNTNTNFSLETTATDLTYKWTFYSLGNEDSTVYTTSSVDKTYVQEGSYDISLEVTDSNGCVTNFNKTIFVTEAIQCVDVDGTMLPDSNILEVGANTTFSLQTTTEGLSYRWLFSKADGTVDFFDFNSTVEKSYSEPGFYNVALAVTDTNNCITNFRKTVEVKPACVINGTIKTSRQNSFVYVYNNFSFETTATDLTYNWSFYNLDNSSYTSYTTSNVDYYYSAVGNYNVKLIVTDSSGCSVTFNKTITVTERPACVDLVGKIKIPSGVIVTGVNNTFSFESAATDLTYQWVIYDSNGSTVLSTQTTSTANYSYLNSGYYRVNLITTDEYACQSVFREYLTVYKACSSVTGSIIIPTETIATNQDIPFTFNTTATNLSYKWTFYNLDNSVRSIETTSAVNKSYTSPGTYLVNLEITGQDGCKIAFNKTVTITGDCAINGTLIMNPENPVLFTYTYFGFETNSTNLKYRWEFYDPNDNFIGWDDTQTPYFYFQGESGNYKIKLIVSDSNGCTLNLEKTVNVQFDCSRSSVDGTLYNSSHYAYYSPYVAINAPNKFTFWPYSGGLESLTLNWELTDVNGTVTTATGPEFVFTPTTFDNLNLNLTITDSYGCPHLFSRELEVLDACTFSDETLTGSIVFDNENNIEVPTIEINQTKNLIFRPYEETGKTYTYNWKIYDANDELINSGNQEKISLTLANPGFYKVTVEIKNETGCILTFSKHINCLIQNSCTNANPNSEIVKKVFTNFVTSLIVRSLTHETDYQINDSRTRSEFNVLKPYITNGTKNKIYNYTSVRDEKGKLTSIKFSFSPDRDYDVQVLVAKGMWNYVQYTDGTINEFSKRINAEIYFDLSQYTSSDNYLTSCYIQNAQEITVENVQKIKKTSKQTAIEPNFCQKGTEIRYIDFCPAEACLPTVGVIQSGFSITYPSQQSGKNSQKQSSKL